GPRRARRTMAPVLRHDDRGVRHTAGPFVRQLRSRVGQEHARAAAGEVESVLALRQPDARGVTTDHALTTRVFGAVQHKHPPALHYRSRIERGVLLPPHNAVAQGRAELGREARRDGGVHLAGFLNRTEHPRAPLCARRLSREGAERGQEHYQDEGLQRAAPAKSVTVAASVRTLAWSAAAGTSRWRSVA